jgi:hypothetical protein
LEICTHEDRQAQREAHGRINEALGHARGRRVNGGPLRGRRGRSATPTFDTVGHSPEMAAYQEGRAQEVTSIRRGGARHKQHGGDGILKRFPAWSGGKCSPVLPG